MIAMHLLCSIAIQPNLELKTQPKQLLGYLPLIIALAAQMYKTISDTTVGYNCK
jgi:hypothetical protein